jgi:hypothetical protein
MTALDTSHFIGTDNWYEHGLNPLITFTDGVKYVADTAQAYWLIDEIAFAPVKGEFQVWKLNVTGNKAELICEDGNDNIIFTKQIEFTDYPEPGVTLWCVGGVILLPSEY